MKISDGDSDHSGTIFRHNPTVSSPVRTFRRLSGGEGLYRPEPTRTSESPVKHKVRTDRRLPSFNLLLESSVVSEVITAQFGPGQHTLVTSIPNFLVGTIPHQTFHVLYDASLIPKLM